MTMLLIAEETTMLPKGVAVEIIKRYVRGEAEYCLVRPYQCKNTFVHIESKVLGEAWEPDLKGVA